MGEQYTSLDNVDTRLAGYFYEFLTGKTNKLPSPRFVKQLISSTPEIFHIVSTGYGLIITKDLNITITENETNTTSRTDIITANSYMAYKTEKRIKVRLILISILLNIQNIIQDAYPFYRSA